MNTIFGTFMEKVIPNLKNAIIKLTIGGNESEMSLEDLKANIVPAPAEPSYKVYTALLTQSGESEPLDISSGDLTIGVTYYIDDNASNPDFTNVGAPNNNVGTYFVATGTTPNTWGEATLAYNAAAPTVTVLENTLGNVWFTYNNTGIYGINSDGLFTEKTFMEVLNVTNINNNSSGSYFIGVGLFESDSWLTIQSVALTDGDMYNTPIEIRVYN